jgi:WD40 repeat protein
MPADGSRLAVAGQDETVEVYDLTHRTLTGRLESSGGSVVFSRDGRLLAIGSFNGTISVFDGETLEANGDRLTGGTACPINIEFSGDSSMLFSAGLDNAMRFWDLAARTQVGPAIAVVEPWFGVSPSGDEVAATTTAGVQRFTLDRDELRAACRIAGRELTEDEARRFVGEQIGPLCA